MTAAIVRLASAYGRYGYRRITALLHGEGWYVNHKRVERIWRREGLKVPAKQPGLSDSLCLGRFSDINETLTEDDGELCLGLGPFTRRAFPSLGRMIEHQI